MCVCVCVCVCVFMCVQGGGELHEKICYNCHFLADSVVKKIRLLVQEMGSILG